jgi:imidazolonepropionase
VSPSSPALAEAEIVFRHCRQLVTCGGPAPRRGHRQAEIETIADGAVAVAGERIVFAGPTTELEIAVQTSSARIFDIPSLSIVPGFVDAHTHAVFAGDRRSELQQRLAGATYADIAARGGGIVGTVAATRRASEEELVEQSRGRLEEMLANGTTTCELKSGYGLDLESELKILRAIRRLAETQPIDVIPTFMGAHEVPIEHRQSRAAYVKSVVDEMIPAVAAERLAAWCDVFC